MNRPFLLLASALTFMSCASVKDPWMVAFTISDTERSAALSRAGQAEYREKLIKGDDLTALDRARKYLKAALRYNPLNADATRYLDMVENYRSNNAAMAMAKARELQKKAVRSEDEDYRMYAAIRRASMLMPADAEIKKALKETADAREALSEAYVVKANKARTGVGEKATARAKEEASIEAFKVIARAVDIDPNNSAARDLSQELRTEIEFIVEHRIAELKKFYASASFSEARTQISLLSELDGKLGRLFEAELTNETYTMYFSWAVYHEKRKEWLEAEARVQQAMAIKRTAETTSLLKRVGNARAESERGEGFDAGLKNVDAMIARGDLAAAKHQIASLTKAAVDEARKTALEERQNALNGAVAANYSKGVKAYREERFKDAIAALSSVVAVNETYEDASDYLDKAQSKQKLVEQY